MMEQYLRGLGGVVFLRKFDLFSQPFQHRVDYNQKTKKTAFGGFLSVIIVILALLYLVYILYLFFNGDYTPAITSSTTSEEGLTTYDIDFSPFAFAFRSDNSIFAEWESLFTVSMFLDNAGTGASATKSYKIVKCVDVMPDYTNIASHHCIDTNNAPNISLQTNQSSPKDDLMFNFFLSRNPSNPSGAGTKLQEKSFVLELVFIYQRYDTTTRTLKKIIERENIMIDPSLFVQDIYLVTQTELSVDTGFLLSSWETKNFISEFKKTTSVTSGSYIAARYSTLSNPGNILKVCQIKLQDSKITTTIQFPKIAFVLAQFQSIFSTLLIIGILAKMGSENKNVEENIDIIMNNYYKSTALEIDSFLEEQKQNSSKKHLQIQPAAETKNNGKIDEVAQNSKIKNRLFNLYQFKLLKHFMQDGEKIDENTGDIQLKSFKKAIKKSWSLMNAHQMHLEMLRSKTALQLLLTDKQYASLDYVSRKMHPDPLTMNHLEIQDQIDDNAEVRMKKAIEYFEELQAKDKVSDPLDQKFKNSFLKSIFLSKPERQSADEEMANLKTDKQQDIDSKGMSHHNLAG